MPNAPCVFLALAVSAAVPATAAPPTVGATVPDLTLASLDGGENTLSERAGPTVLVFFRGVW